jgi:hypothetical protein
MPDSDLDPFYLVLTLFCLLFAPKETALNIYHDVAFF